MSINHQALDEDEIINLIIGILKKTRDETN